jgi:hypothetical protein
VSERLNRFCHIIRSEYGSPAEVSPDDMAQEFVQHSGISSVPGLTELHTVLRRYGVNDITPTDLSAGKMKGHHFSYRGANYTVLYDIDLWRGSIEHVMLHELYEIICETCQGMCSDYRVPPVPRICPQANRFAAAVLMQPGIFMAALLDTGLNIVQLHHRFQKAYSSVALRAVDLLNERNENLSWDENIDLITVIYERTDEGHPTEWGSCTLDKLQAGYVLRTRGFRHVTSHSGLTSNLIPRRGDGVMDNSLVCKVIETGKCHYLKRVTGFDFWGIDDLSFLAQPVWWFGQLAKVIMIGVHARNSYLLDMQMDGIHPIIIDESYQIV